LTQEKVKRKKEKTTPQVSAVARDRPARDDAAIVPPAEVSSTHEPAARLLPTADPAATEPNPETPAQAATADTIAAEPVPVTVVATRKRTHREASTEYWRDVKAGRRVRKEKKWDPPVDDEPPEPGPNPLFDLCEEERSKLFVWLRECPYFDAVRNILRNKGVPEVSDQQLEDFFQQESYDHWEVRTLRASTEADALVRLAEASVPRFSAGMLAALGQEAFRQIVSGNADPVMMTRLVTLFIKARSDDRADQMQVLKLEKLQGEIDDKLTLAFAKLAEQVEQHPAAREAFAALQRELAGNEEEQ